MVENIRDQRETVQHGNRAELKLCSSIRNQHENTSGASMEVQWMTGCVKIASKYI